MEEIRRALKDVIYASYGVDVEVELTVAPEGTGADYATNVAMRLAKIVHRNPMVIAEELASAIAASNSPVRAHRTSSTARLRSSSFPSTSSKPSSSAAEALTSDIATSDSSMRACRTSSTDHSCSSSLPSTSSKSSSSAVEALTSDIAEMSGVDFEVSVAAPGFLNFRMGDAYFEAIVEGLAEKVELGVDDYRGKVVVTEFSDPNPFKVLHVGHLYTSIVGDSISRLLELAGAKVVRVNFGGDVGLHVAKTLWACDESLKRDASAGCSVRGDGTEGADFLRASDPSSISSLTVSSDDGGVSASGCVGDKVGGVEDLTVEDLARCYVEGTQAYDEDEEARREIVALNKEIYRVNAEDLHGERIWDLYWRGRELSYQYFDEFYEKIGVKFDKYYPESSVAGRGLEEVRAHTGSVYEESEGAVVYHGEKVGLHTRVFINREGVPTYETKDVGLIFTKWDDWHFDESVVVTGNEQTDYMRVVLASVSEYAPELTERTRHLTHGLVKLAGNVKMSSRKGNFLKAVDVLEMVQGMLADTFREKSGGNDAVKSADEGAGEEVDWKMVLAAVKYAFLKYKMGGDIIFDPKESVSTVGNSGIYILYAIVRAKKILQKAEKAGSAGEGKVVRATEKTDYERGLCKKMAQYVEVIREAVAEKAPNKICTYLYELAQAFSRFYEHVQVVGSADEAELLKVVRAYLNVMTHGVALLGIEVPEEM